LRAGVALAGVVNGHARAGGLGVVVVVVVVNEGDLVGRDSVHDGGPIRGDLAHVHILDTVHHAIIAFAEENVPQNPEEGP